MSDRVRASQKGDPKYPQGSPTLSDPTQNIACSVSRMKWTPFLLNHPNRIRDTQLMAKLWKASDSGKLASKVNEVSPFSFRDARLAVQGRSV